MTFCRVDVCAFLEKNGLLVSQKFSLCFYDYGVRGKKGLLETTKKKVLTEAFLLAGIRLSSTRGHTQPWILDVDFFFVSFTDLFTENLRVLCATIGLVRLAKATENVSCCVSAENVWCRGKFRQGNAAHRIKCSKTRQETPLWVHHPLYSSLVNTMPRILDSRPTIETTHENFFVLLID